MVVGRESGGFRPSLPGEGGPKTQNPLFLKPAIAKVTPAFTKNLPDYPASFPDNYFVHAIE
jgi:hypothetical protein